MRLSPLLILVTVTACSASPDRRTDLPEFENASASCVTEEMLREANASEDDIKQFRRDEAEANHRATCG